MMDILSAAVISQWNCKPPPTFPPLRASDLVRLSIGVIGILTMLVFALTC